MIGVLFTTPFKRDKKLLTFSDSVQDAAHRAGFYGARTYRTTLRTAIANTVTAFNGSTLQTLIEQFPNHWRQQIGSPGDYVATFIPTDLEWLREWDQFLHSDSSELASDTKLPDLTFFGQKFRAVKRIDFSHDVLSDGMNARRKYDFLTTIFRIDKMLFCMRLLWWLQPTRTAANKGLSSDNTLTTVTSVRNGKRISPLVAIA